MLILECLSKDGKLFNFTFVFKEGLDVFKALAYQIILQLQVPGGH